MAESAGHHNYINTTWGRSLVSEYTGLNFHQVGQLDYGTYLLWLRDAYISGLSRTEEGRQYLDDCWRMEQTKPDRAKLRHQFGRGASNGQ
jgi:hypothetical protein